MSWRSAAGEWVAGTHAVLGGRGWRGGGLESAATVIATRIITHVCLSMSSRTSEENSTLLITHNYCCYCHDYNYNNKKK